MIVSGLNGKLQLLVPSNNKDKDDSLPCVCPPRKVNLDVDTISKFSIGSSHSVFLTSDGRIFAAGNDKDFSIGTPTATIFKELTEIQIKGLSSPISQVFCGQDYTMYLADDGHLAFCTNFFNERVPIICELPTKPLFLSGGLNRPLVIDTNGDLYVFQRNPKKTPFSFTFNEPVFDACLLDEHEVIIVVLISGKVMIKDPDKVDFRYLDTFDEKIRNIFGYSSHCIAISESGRAFSLGSNESGQLGDGTTNDSFAFVEVKFPNSGIKVVNASVGCDYSLFVTDDGKLYGCGGNCYGELMQNVLNRKSTTTPKLCCFSEKVVHVFTGNNSSIALVDGKPPVHEGYEFFKDKML
ncbi:hypothetical protein TRFO_42603 [Tritrichomonas foetus]|uniref:Regulator of chromosome condensation n=1 Tax=Tritrichomonas foetus TaxID=1144522 RepID=A0A1J4KVL1_9EUKA|nr:hypothetical protein TRFO_42603 [Tritrichomonas foetus]|eukprot:OHT15279.1 hypothetical protein TRFO_42603 [Tritrichomonas foetus]